MLPNKKERVGEITKGSDSPNEANGDSKEDDLDKKSADTRQE